MTDKKLPKVLIDGVRYVPLTTLQPPSLEVIRDALLELWWGPKPWPDDAARVVYITISDDEPETSHPELQPTVEAFIEALALKLV